MLADRNRFTQTHAAIFSHAFFWRVSSALTAFWSSCSNITSGFSLFIPVMFLFPSSRKKVALFHWLSLIQMLTVSVIVSFFVLRTRHEVNFVENKVHLDSIARSRDKKTKPLLQKRANEAAIEKSLSPLEGNIKWSTTNKCWSVYLGMKGGVGVVVVEVFALGRVGCWVTRPFSPAWGNSSWTGGSSNRLSCCSTLHPESTSIPFMTF